ncbi:MAG: Gfo/Idh/MocA family protein [Sediminispirochaetaceae bacterium]
MGKKNQTIRVGIIGCGKIANSKHMPGLARIEGVEICAFQNRTKSKAVTAAERFGSGDTRVYDTYDELVQDPSLDVVHICTSNESHSAISIAALEAGKHVMCEKPMALNSLSAREMVETAEKNGKLLSISYQNRFRADSRYLKQLCREGGLGDIYFAKAHAVRRRRIPTWGDFLDREKQGGGALIDIGTHALDLTLWLMNNYEPRMVTGKAYNLFGRKENIELRMTPESSREYDIDDSAFALIQMKDGATIILECSWALNTLEIGEAKATLCGTRGGADMKDGLRLNGVAQNNLYETRVDAVDELDPGFREMESWITSIREGDNPVVQAREALVVAELLDAIYESSETGQPDFFD